MAKDFTRWTTFKEKLDASEKTFIYRSGDVWWCALGINIGHEQDADATSLERPVLIITTFSNDTCLCVPITSSALPNPFYRKVLLSGENAYVIISQLRTISTKRLLRKIETIPHKNFKGIKSAIRWIIN